MKKISVLLIAAIALLASCSKEVSFENQLKLDKEIISTYLKIMQLEDVAEELPSGLTYIVVDSGVGTERPNIASEVTVNYIGYYPEGGTFDSGNNISFPLTGVIAGWQEGIQLMHKDETMKLLIPSYLAYGKTGRGPIPPNQVLIFDVKLLDF